jgi:hypothetical protein
VVGADRAVERIERGERGRELMLDKINGTIIAAALLGVPAWLVWRAWRRYFASNQFQPGKYTKCGS